MKAKRMAEKEEIFQLSNYKKRQDKFRPKRGLGKKRAVKNATRKEKNVTPQTHLSTTARWGYLPSKCKTRKKHPLGQRTNTIVDDKNNVIIIEQLNGRSQKL